ncbi:MAG: DNA polymerase III subunit delta [Anaerolineaceae bacterium]|nr:DNA polymerase III subunit delta [Anaerolineaceae bacterium]
MDPAPSAYILHGGDALRQKSQLAKFRAQMGSEETASLNIHEFDGETSSVNEILAAATAVPFLSERRLVIVRGLLQALVKPGANQKILGQLLTALPELPAFTRLVFVENETLKATHPVLKFAQASASALVIENRVTDRMPQWLQHRAQREYGAEIELTAAQALASVVDGDIHRADNELFKLASYTNQRRPISLADVTLHTPYIAPTNIFHLVDALAAGHQREAMRQLQDLLAADERDPVMVLGMIIRQFRLLLLTKEHLERQDASDLAKAIQVHPFVARKLREQVRRFTMDQLESIHHHLHERDIAIKRGDLSASLVLQMLIAELSPDKEAQTS